MKRIKNNCFTVLCYHHLLSVFSISSTIWVALFLSSDTVMNFIKLMNPPLILRNLPFVYTDE
jgi:uncharacterized protein (DUF1919 family)